jgi:hypothetical protein
MLLFGTLDMHVVKDLLPSYTFMSYKIAFDCPTHPHIPDLTDQVHGVVGTNIKFRALVSEFFAFRHDLKKIQAIWHIIGDPVGEWTSVSVFIRYFL